MLTAFAESNTYFKSKVLGPDDLTNFEKAFVRKGDTFPVSSRAPVHNQHVHLELVNPITALDGHTRIKDVYVYDPHVTVQGDTASQELKLDVPYFSQLNQDTQTFGGAWRQCNTASNAMLADYLLNGELSQQARAQGFREPESIYMRVVKQYGDTTSEEAQTKALQYFGIDSFVSPTLPLQKVQQSLQTGVPTVLRVALRSGDHYILVVGQDPSRRIWYAHDPYGVRHGTSDNYEVGADGSFDAYSYEVLGTLFDPLGTGGSGRVVTRVRNQPTGL